MNVRLSIRKSGKVSRVAQQENFGEDSRCFSTTGDAFFIHFSRVQFEATAGCQKVFFFGEIKSSLSLSLVFLEKEFSVKSEKFVEMERNRLRFCQERHS